jgi:prophage regulatory protein
MKNHNIPPKRGERLLRWPDVQDRVGICRSHANMLIKQNRFPRSISLTGGRAVAWLESDIDAWIAEKIRQGS